MNLLLLFCVAISLASPLCRAYDLPDFDPSLTIVQEAKGWSPCKKFLTPIFKGQYPACGDPCVLRDGGLLRMYYTGYDPDRKRPEICQATSADGVKWEFAKTGEASVRGRMLAVEKTPWQDTHETCFALHLKKEYLLYFSGYNSKGGSFVDNFPAAIGLATSEDGVHFKPLPDPILRGTPEAHDSDALFSPSVVEHDGKLWMVYCGHAWHNKKGPKGTFLLGATSTDGRVWVKNPTPLFEGAKLPSFFKEFAGEPELVKGPDGLFYLFFTALQGDNPHVVGVACSAKPFGPWEFRPEPLLKPSANGFDAKEIVAPSVLIENNTVRIWFSGFSKFQTIAIGYAEAPWPLRSSK